MESGGGRNKLFINNQRPLCSMFLYVCVCVCVQLIFNKYSICNTFSLRSFSKIPFSIEPCQNQILEIYFFKLDITGNIRHFFPKRINGISMFEKSSRKWSFSSWWAVTWTHQLKSQYQSDIYYKSFFSGEIYIRAKKFIRQFKFLWWMNSACWLFQSMIFLIPYSFACYLQILILGSWIFSNVVFINSSDLSFLRKLYEKKFFLNQKRNSLQEREFLSRAAQ